MDAKEIEKTKESLRSTLSIGGKQISYYSIKKLASAGLGDASRLPFSLKVILESLIRNLDGVTITEEDLKNVIEWDPKNPKDVDIPFKVSRVLMQDFTGVPAIVDLAAMREYVSKKGANAEIVKPQIPTDLVIDHSVQVDAFDSPDALYINQQKESERNSERYKLLKWASQSFDNFRVFPPSAGICHQLNIEYIATCVTMRKNGNVYEAFPDTLVGTDSHTTMINALGVVGFGVGGIEADAALMGEPISIAMPKVLGVRLTGRLPSGATATDFALSLTRVLREKGVVNMFVEFFGEGLASLSLPDRATLSNMCPEYGATVAIFPVDEETLRYMRMTGRSAESVDLVREYYNAQGMFGSNVNADYSDTIEVDLSKIVPSVSGPSQPKQQMPLGAIKEEFLKYLASGSSQGSALKSATISYQDGAKEVLSDGDVVISSITSCTNTSNPYVMIAAGLLAKKAVEKGLRVNTRKVKTSMGLGSRVVTRYLEKAGLLEPLAKLGYSIVGYGCLTCIGNSGPLIEKQSEAINSNGLSVASVLSGNRNFEGRIHVDVKANYLMSPPLVVAFGIAGTVLKDLTKEPLAINANGEEVYLSDIYPTKEEVNEVIERVVSEDLFAEEYGSNIFKVNPYWNSLSSPSGKMYEWDDNSTYIRQPPFFGNPVSSGSIENARVLAVFGDSISTDHISPAGEISPSSPAGKYLLQHGVKEEDFNTYGSRRGNHEVMMRGTFANSRIVNLMLGGEIGGLTIHYPSGEKMTIFDAAMRYKDEGVPLVVIAGAEYGSGSSRDWAAKGPMLLGVKAVIAKSFERIHRSNLIGMGIIPLQFAQGEDFKTLAIDLSKTITIEVPEELSPRATVAMKYYKKGSNEESVAYLKCRIDTNAEVEHYKSGGILNYVAKKMLSAI
ncbi:MAG: aconitate hydratase AcnA [Candidatus Micrarchaeia archaeon]